MTHPNNYTRQRHIFRVELPEDIRTPEMSKAQAFMDVRIYPTNTIAPEVEIDTYGVVLDGYWIERPTWIDPQRLNDEKEKIKL